MKMKKITESIVVVSLLSVVFFCPKVLADENNNEETFIEYDYVTGEEKEIVIEKKILYRHIVAMKKKEYLYRTVMTLNAF